MLQLVSNIKNNFQAFKVLVGINIRTTVLSTRLGWLWWILDPLIMMCIYYFLVKGVFGRGGEDYHLFVLCGIVSWQFFIRSINSTIKIIPGNKQIIRQIVFPLPVLVAVPVVTHFFFAAIGMFVVALFNLSVVSMATLAVIPLFLVIGTLSYGIGLFVSVLSVFIGDTGIFISYILRAGFFLSPILYPASRVFESEAIPESLKAVIQLNPMVWILPAVRKVMLAGEVYELREFLLLAAVVLLIVQVGLWWMRANSSRIIKIL